MSESHHKRRRVLSDIVNTAPEMIDSARRKSLGFDLVRIDHGSSIPNPPQESTQLINQKAEQNRVGSAIPSITRSQMYNKYLQVNRSLSEKCKINSATLDVPFDDSADADSLQSLDSLMSDQIRLQRAVEDASKTLDALKTESKDLERTHKRLKRHSSEKETQIRLLASNFETQEQKIQAAVEHEAHMTDLRLREHENKLLDDYNDAKFKLEAEVAQNARFDDPELTSAIQELEKKKQEVDAELQSTVAKKHDVVQQEIQLMDAEIEKTLQQKTTEVEVASNKFQKLQLNLEQITAEYESLVELANLKQSTKAELELQVKQMNEQFRDLDRVRTELNREIALAKADLLAVQGEDLEWLQRVDYEKAEYLAVKKKHQAYSRTRRLLEHAIMGYSEATRRYVRIEKTAAEVSENQVIFNGARFHFEKTGVLQENADYALEWELLVKDAIKSSASIIFCGNDRKPSMHFLLPAYTFLKDAQESLKDWSFEVYLQSVFFDGKEVFDILNASTDSTIQYSQNSLSVVSQRMLVHTDKDLAVALKHEGDVDKAVLHVFTISGMKENHKTSTQVNIMNISNLGVDAQVEALCNDQTTLGKLVNHLLSVTNSVCSCDIAPCQPQQINRMLRSLQELR